MTDKQLPPSETDFDEEWYLSRYPDVAAAVEAGKFVSGAAHYEQNGRDEGRSPIPNHVISETSDHILLRPSDRLWQIFAAHRVSFGARKPRDVPFFIISKSARIEPYCDWTNGGILNSMGAFSYQMSGAADVSAGRYCSIAPNTDTLGERHPLEHVTTSSFVYGAPRPSFEWARKELLGGRADMVQPTILTGPVPRLEHDVWIGQAALLQRGITLHTGCIVAAGAIVTKDVPPYAIVAGSPARVIRLRFPERIIERLLASQWWTLHPRILFDLNIRDPESFLGAIEDGQGIFEEFYPAVLTCQDILNALDVHSTLQTSKIDN
jgi:acetyltransferase-like isoleucine patch superfamily enzyme